MSISKKQFDVLSLFATSDKKFSQRQVSKEINASVGTVNKIMGELAEAGLIKDGAITEKGINALEPYRAKRAVFIAAGFGSRLVPMTLNTPKPLVRVNGVRIIDTLLDACIAADINEIYIVRGYLAEQFDQLLYKYPMIKFIDNPLFNEANNISSVLLARDLLKGAYVFEADLFLYNPKIIKKYHYTSDVFGIWKER
ncbi:MAG: NTP transferase domain-containing protein, partial [Clostridia bacterium]|nr:NTP transferase domain-containing protein [Clostridia bacterium]